MRDNKGFSDLHLIRLIWSTVFDPGVICAMTKLIIVFVLKIISPRASFFKGMHFSLEIIVKSAGQSVRCVSEGRKWTVDNNCQVLRPRYLLFKSSRAARKKSNIVTKGKKRNLNDIFRKDKRTSYKRTCRTTHGWHKEEHSQQINLRNKNM